MIFGWSEVAPSAASAYIEDATSIVEMLPPRTLVTVLSAPGGASASACRRYQTVLSGQGSGIEADRDLALDRDQAIASINYQLACYNPDSVRMDLLGALQDSPLQASQEFQATRIIVYSQGRQYSDEIRLTNSVLTSPSKLQDNIDKLTTENLLFPPVAGGQFSMTTPQPNSSLNAAEARGIIEFWRAYAAQSHLQFA